MFQMTSENKAFNFCDGLHKLLGLLKCFFLGFGITSYKILFNLEIMFLFFSWDKTTPWLQTQEKTWAFTRNSIRHSQYFFLLIINDFW